MCFVSFLILFYYSYLIHYFIHKIPDNINLHILYHHNKGKPKIINFYIELLLDIGFFVLFYFLKQLLGLTFITNSLIFYFGFIYVSVHLVNYSIFHTTKNHTNHHFINNKTKRNCNYGPDTLDHLFNSNCDEKFEDLNHIIPNSLISFLLTNYLFDLRLL